MSEFIVQMTREELRSDILAAMEEHEKTKKLDIQKKPSGNYTRKEAANELKVSLVTLNRLMQSGTIPCHKIGGRVLIKKEDLENAIVANPKKFRR